MWRERSVDIGDSRMLRESLILLNESEKFEGFDRFLLRKYLSEEQEKELESGVLTEEMLRSLREEAYLAFYKQVKPEKVASRVTIKKWFGLDGCAKPKRKQIMKLAFALHFDEEELQEYLIHGILQPGIQINDYREMIYLYGLKSGLSYDECVDMIEVFEIHVNKDTILAQNTHTLYLWKLFRENCDKPKEEFLSFMCNNAGLFKGYGKVALRHFMEMKSEILGYVRESAKVNLLQLLEETDFFEWAAQNGLSEEVSGENISRYIKNVSRRKDKGALTDVLKEEILELNWVVYSSRDRTTDLLAELYASAIESDRKKQFQGKRIQYKNRKEFKLPEQIFFMTDKYVSQIVGIAQHKEKEIRLSQALGSLKHVDGECPEWIGRLLLEYGVKTPKDVKQVRELLQECLTDQERRCQLVQREDLLPLIHYVAQRRYDQMRYEQNIAYQCEEAKAFFVQTANGVLEECQMAPISAKYQLDYLLLSCFGKKDMCSLADAIEESELM